MRRLSWQCSSERATLSLALATVLCARLASAAQLTLTGTDTAHNESGFRVERTFGSIGSFAQLATGPPGVVLPGTFTPAPGQWQRDRNGTGVFDVGFRQAGDLPIAADWPRTGIIRQSLPSFPR
jgi:hypothetical protein